MPVPPGDIRSRLEHHPGLDGLRAIAVFLVLYNHAPMLLGKNDGSDGWFWSKSAGAWLGVDLFFVLSGFLITTLLLHARGRPGALRRFWVRRAFRILPLAMLYLTVLGLVGWLLPSFAHLHDPGALLWAAGYAVNFRIAFWGWTNAAVGILWTLSVEEQFYLLWPLVILSLRSSSIAIVLGGIVMLTPVLRALLLDDLGRTGVYVATFCRWDTLAVGGLLALLWHGRWRRSVERIAPWLLLPAVAWIVWVIAQPLGAVQHSTPRWFYVVGFSGIAVACGIIVANGLRPPVALRWLLAESWLARAGRISYGLYVWHVLTAMFVAQLTARLCPNWGIEWRVLAWVAVLFAVAAISFRGFELPMLRLRERFEGGAAGGPAAIASVGEPPSVRRRRSARKKA